MNRDPCLKPSAPTAAMHPDHRLTRNQDAVLAVLQEQRSPLSAQALYRLMRDRQPMGLATVYRALDVLKLKGLVQHRVSLEGESLYSSMHQDLHYLTCLHCGQSFALDHCPVAPLEDQIQASGSFKVYYHTLEFFGLCEPCAHPAPPSPSAIHLDDEAHPNQDM